MYVRSCFNGYVKWVDLFLYLSKSMREYEWRCPAILQNDGRCFVVLVVVWELRLPHTLSSFMFFFSLLSIRFHSTTTNTHFNIFENFEFIIRTNVRLRHRGGGIVEPVQHNNIYISLVAMCICKIMKRHMSFSLCICIGHYLCSPAMCCACYIMYWTVLVRYDAK